MFKRIKSDIIYYVIQWSPQHEYHRILASRILPDMPGILLIEQKRGNVTKPQLVYATWRDGLRMSMRDLFDDQFSKCKSIIPLAETRELVYRYTVIDTNKSDLHDVFYWTLRAYQPALNQIKGFKSTGRYKDIIVTEEFVKNTLESRTTPPGYSRT